MKIKEARGGKGPLRKGPLLAAQPQPLKPQARFANCW
jgi:hypothetical protein